MSAQKCEMKEETEGLLRLCIGSEAGRLGWEGSSQSSAVAQPYLRGAGGASGVCVPAASL